MSEEAALAILTALPVLTNLGSIVDTSHQMGGTAECARANHARQVTPPEFFTERDSISFS